MKTRWLLTALVPALLLTGCGKAERVTPNQPNGVSHVAVDNDPLAKHPNLNQSSGQNEADWLHENADQLAKIISSSHGAGQKEYAKGFSNGSDNGYYLWNNKVHRQSNNATNAMISSGATNGMISTNDMNNKYYRIGWILSNSQGAIQGDNGQFHGAQSAARYANNIKRYEAGRQYINTHHDKKGAAFDDGVNKWYGSNAFYLNTAQY